MKLYHHLILALLLCLTACTNDYDFTGNSDYVDPATKTQTDESTIAFSSVVISNRQATRADGTILNMGETSLDENKQVGIFGVYTGQHTWSSLVQLSKDESPTDEETAILNNYYTANLMYNNVSTVGADGKTLTYSPLRFWSNNVLTSGDEAGQHEYMTFWAYYPYNATSTMGDYGIAINESTTGQGVGMGRVKFTMHPDASEQNDFLISAPVTDCNRDKYPLLRTDDTPSYSPKPVQFRLYHMLAQVRFYAYVRGADKMVYVKEDGKDKVTDDTWFTSWAVDGTIIDPWGNVYTKKGDNDVEQTTTGKGNLTKAEFLDLGLKVPDETQCERWERTDVWDVTHSRRRADITYTLEFNNIKTTSTFYPLYDNEGKNATIAHDEPTTLGSATINQYTMNPYWFTFKDGERERLNDNYMFGYYEDTPVAHQFNASTEERLHEAAAAASLEDYDDVDGIDWTGTTDPLNYLAGKTDEEKAKLLGKGTNSEKHYNYAPGNILLVVPQTLSDDDVPHLVIQASGNTTINGVEQTNTAKVTINMLKMGISWTSGYIYCYAFLENELRPGDDKVRGPESITPLFNTAWSTDQW